MTDRFELRFEGPADDTAPTLRRIKGVFVADLEFPASDVQRFLENAPIAIKTADSESELQESLKLLSNAGARVLIVKIACDQPDTADQAGTLSFAAPELPPLELEFDSVISDQAKEIIPCHLNPVETLELSLDLTDSASPADTKNHQTPGKPRTEDTFDYGTLDLRLEEPLSEIPNIQNNSQQTNSKENLTEPHIDLDFTGGLSLESEPVSSISDTVIKNQAAKPASQETQTSPTVLELEVIAPQGSTLFGNSDSHKVEDLADSGNDSTESAAVSLQTAEPITEDPSSQEQKDSDKPGNSNPADLSDKTDTTSNNAATSLCEEEEKPIELTLEQLQELQKPAKKSLQVPLLPILAICLLLLLFLINRSFLGNSEQTNPFSALIEQIPVLSPEADKEEQEKALAAKAAELAETAWFSAERNLASHSLKANIWTEKNTPIHGSIEISTPEPAALSKEEIVNGVSPRPWLRRIELKDLVFKNDNSSSVAIGPALAYISVGEKNIRLSGNASIKAAFSEDKNSLLLEIRASSDQSKIESFSAEFRPEELSFSLDSGLSDKKNYFNFSDRVESKRR